MIGIYIRVSTEKQTKKYSPTAQKEQGINFAQNQNEAYEIYDEDYESGTNFERKALQRLLHDINNKKIDTVWCIEQSRLVRDADDASIIKKHFLKNKCKLFIDGAECDLSNPDALMMFRFKSAIDEREIQTIKDRMRRGREVSFDQGRKVKSRLLGYTFVWNDGKRKWIIDQENAKIVKLMFDYWVNKNYNITKIKKELNLRYGTKCRWSEKYIWNYLSCVEYVGKTRDSKGNIIPSKIYDPIIDEPTFEKAQILINLYRNKEQTRQVRIAHDDLSGVIKCFYCKAIFKYRNQLKNYKRRGKNKGLVSTYQNEIYYHEFNMPAHGCKNKIKTIYKVKLSPVFKALVQRFILNYDEIQKWKDIKRKEIEELYSANDARNNSLSNQLIILKKEKSNLIDAVAKGLLDETIINDKMIEIKNKEQSINDQLNLLKVEMSNRVNEMEKLILMDYVNANQSTPDQRRKFYKNILSESYIKDETLHLQFLTGKIMEVNLLNITKAMKESIHIIEGINTELEDVVQEYNQVR